MAFETVHAFLQITYNYLLLSRTLIVTQPEIVDVPLRLTPRESGNTEIRFNRDLYPGSFLPWSFFFASCTDLSFGSLIGDDR
jgi:hypothetical protein